MPEDHHILDKGFKNVTENGEITGFQVQVMSEYYRGIYLCLIEDVEVTVNGETFKKDRIKFTTGGRTFTIDELDKVTDARWQWLEPAILTVSKPGGLKPGVYEVQVVHKDRISYMPIIPTVRTYKKKISLMS